jgi:Utp25, U3 small nucleolar RNA-associated SSU processome protein 25
MFCTCVCAYTTSTTTTCHTPPLHLPSLLLRDAATSQGVGAADESSAEPEPPRDQGFTRPKALILLPMRNSAYRVVRRLTALAQRETRADSVQARQGVEGGAGCAGSSSCSPICSKDA